jgi:hypothetical protein
LRSWPDAAAFDPEEGAAFPALDAVVSGPGPALPAVLLVGATPDPWVARSAAAVARAFVHTGRRIVLIDAGVRAPSLHELLGIPNDEGLADHFAFGTSLDRLARPVEDGSWSLVPAGPATGTAVPGGAAEWQRLIGDAAAQHATLLCFAPHDTPGLAELAERIGAVIGLAPDAGDRERLERVVGRPYSVMAVLERRREATSAPEVPAAVGAIPAEPEPAAAAVVVAEPRVEPAAETPEVPRTPLAREPAAGRPAASVILPRDTEARQELIADLRARQRAALQAPPPQPYEGRTLGPSGAPWEAAGVKERGTPEPAGGRPEEPPVVRRPAEAGRPARRLLLLVLLLLVSLLAGAWHFRDRLTGLWPRRAAAPVPAPVAVPEAPPPQPLDSTDTALPYLVAVEAHQQLPTAEQRVLALRNMQAGLDFLITPLVREGTLYYHVMSGPVADSAAARSLLEDLLRRRVKTGSTPGDVRFAPLAFLLAEYATRDSADARLARLRLLDIPAYTLALGPAPSRWRIYAGGYRGPAEADVMRQLLESAGVPDSLVPRTGRISR